MIYLVDASTLIEAHESYYALNRVPEFWAWLRHHGDAGSIKIPRLIYSEIEDGTGALAEWVAQEELKAALRFTEEPELQLVQQVLGFYGEGLTEAQIEQIGKDPFLIAAALVDTANRCVVTAEVSKPNRVGANRHIPNVCTDCAVQCLNPVQFLNALDFSTGWAG